MAGFVRSLDARDSMSCVPIHSLSNQSPLWQDKHTAQASTGWNRSALAGVCVGAETTMLTGLFGGLRAHVSKPSAWGRQSLSIRTPHVHLTLWFAQLQRFSRASITNAVGAVLHEDCFLGARAMSDHDHDMLCLMWRRLSCFLMRKAAEIAHGGTERRPFRPWKLRSGLCFAGYS